jgi:integrase
MPTLKMTDRSVAAIRPPVKGQADYWDSKLPGFGIRVSAGRKSWTLLYRHGATKRRLTLGTYPILPLADARELAEKALHGVQFAGRDPATEKKLERVAETFEELARDYIERHAKREKRSWRKDELILERDALPRFGRKRAKEITRREIIAMLDDIVARGSPIQANRVLEVVRKLFNWAIGKDILETNPCYRVPKPSSENKSDRVLSEAEIKSVWMAAEAEPPLTAAIFKLRLMTAQRGAEVLALRWDQIVDAWWTIPAEVAKNGLAHRVFLSPQVLALLEEIRPLGKGSQWVFPAGTKSQSKGGHRVAINKAHEHVRARSQVDYVPHDLRRSVASHMTSMGISRLVVGKLLNHVESGVTAVYDRHSYDREKAEALSIWNTRLEEIVTGRSHPEKIIALRR